MSQRLRVLIAEDNRLVRMGIVAWLGLQPDIEIVGEAVNDAEAVTKARATKPDVILLDLGMPIIDGVEVIKQLTRDGSSPKFAL